MNSSKRNQTAPSSSAEFLQEEGGRLRIALQVPASWQALDDRSLRVVLRFLARYPAAEVKIRALVFFAGLQVFRHSDTADGDTRWLIGNQEARAYVATGKLAAASSALDWLLLPATPPVRPAYIEATRNPRRPWREARAVDAQLHGLPFGHYLQLDALYQSYLISRDPAPLRAMAPLLYPGALPEQVSEEELLGMFLWMAAAKHLFAQLFPHLFRPVPDSETAPTITQETLRSQFDSQIRALTDGDITREQAVLEADTWRALTELDAKAREAEQMRRQIEKQSRK